MKILCIIDSLGSGGAQRQLVILAKGLQERGHDVSFLVYHKDDFYNSSLENAGIKIHYTIEPNYAKRLLKMRKYIRNGKFDAVISFLEAANFIATLSGFPFRKWKLIVGERSANPNVLKSFKLRFYRWFHLFADYIVANSQSNIDIVKRINPLLPSRKIKVIYNAVDIHVNLTNIEKKDNYFRMVIGASHRRLKNLDGLVEAVHILPKSIKSILKIDWYGEKNLDDSLKNAQYKIDEYKLQDVFSFYDPTLEIHNRISQADIAGLFSYYEGFPNFICESMAIGKPIICTRVSDLPILLEDNKNAFFCESDSPESIACALQNAVTANKEVIDNMIEKNEGIVKTLFSKENIIDSYLELL
jgi:glycosyltransferase involved in cell wall biosynthesis